MKRCGSSSETPNWTWKKAASDKGTGPDTSVCIKLTSVTVMVFPCPSGFRTKTLIPESGGMLWTDNMMIPALASHKKNAEAIMNYYYDPAVAAEVAAYVQYVSPVKGAKEAMAEIDPALVENPWIFPNDAILGNSYVFMSLTPEQDATYQRAFQKAIGN
jgi:spermidine/putrescine transport system substrate-binding protein